MKYTRYHLWNFDREYQGTTLLQDCTLPRAPYYQAIETPECPALQEYTLPRAPYYQAIETPECPVPPEPVAPEPVPLESGYPDGWYLVTFQQSKPLARRKHGDTAYDAQGLTRAYWNRYEVVASLGDAKFLDGRDE